MPRFAVTVCASFMVAAAALPTAAAPTSSQGVYDCPLARTLTLEQRAALPEPAPPWNAVDWTAYVARHPEAFGGAYRDNAHHAEVVLVVVGHAENDPVLWANRARSKLDLVIRCVRYSHADLEDGRQRVRRFMRRHPTMLRMLGIEVTMWASTRSGTPSRSG